MSRSRIVAKSFIVLAICALNAMAARALPGDGVIAWSNGSCVLAATSRGLFRSEQDARVWREVPYQGSHFRGELDYVGGGGGRLFFLLNPDSHGSFHLASWDVKQGLKDKGALPSIGEPYEQQHNIAFASSKLGYLFGAKKAYVTKDGGEHWSRLDENAISDLKKYAQSPLIPAGDGRLIGSNARNAVAMFACKGKDITRKWTRRIDGPSTRKMSCGDVWIEGGNRQYLAVNPATGVIDRKKTIDCSKETPVEGFACVGSQRVIWDRQGNVAIVGKNGRPGAWTDTKHGVVKYVFSFNRPHSAPLHVAMNWKGQVFQLKVTKEVTFKPLSLTVKSEIKEHQNPKLATPAQGRRLLKLAMKVPKKQRFKIFAQGSKMVKNGSTPREEVEYEIREFEKYLRSHGKK